MYLYEQCSITLISELAGLKNERGGGFAHGDSMRRSQTTILTTLAVIASLLFMSQFPAVSNVANIHPDSTDGTPPPNTDTDGDLIPDVHETLFEEWMNWENMGEWHVDHVRPCASFDLSDPQQQSVCFNWRNLQPLNGNENYEKRDSYTATDEEAWIERMQALGYEGELFLRYEET